MIGNSVNDVFVFIKGGIYVRVSYIELYVIYMNKMVKFVYKYVDEMIVFIVGYNFVVKVYIVGFLIIVLIVFYFIEVVIK